MSRQQQTNGSIVQDLLGSAKSTGFWSAIAAVVGVVATAGGLVVILTIDELQNFAVSVLIIGLALLFIALVLSPRAVAVFMAGRQGRYGTNVAIMTLAFFAIIILLNFLLFRAPTRIDVTATRVFTLSQQTIKVLDNIEKPVRANAFFVPSDANTAFAREQAEDLLNEFSRRSRNFTYRFVDPELNKTIADQYDVRRFPVVVFEDLDTGTQQGIFDLTEQHFVTGILVSTGAQQKRVYFLTGHQEASLTRDLATGSVADEGFDFALQGMQRDNYNVLPLNLKQDGAIPSDAAVVVVPGPKTDLDRDEMEAFTEYLLDGGKLVMLLDPDTPNSYREMLVGWGMLVGDGSLADPISNVAGEVTSPLLQKANAQFVTSGITGVPIADQLNVVFFPDSTAILPSIQLEDMPQDMFYSALARTTPASWLESHPEEVEFDAAADLLGSFDIAAVIETRRNLSGQPLNAQGEVAKIVVIGDSDFARNKFFFSSDNADLLLNSVNWLADDFDLISIRPKTRPFRELVLNRRERDFITWSSWFVPPVIMLTISVVVWWRRR